MNEQEDYIQELQENRRGLKELLDDIVTVRNDIKTIAPKSKEFSHRFVLENRMKVISDIISSELSIRKQIDSSIKTEFDLANKSSSEAEIDPRYLAEMLEKRVTEKKLNDKDEKNGKKS